jgi:hypothetical protein
MKITAALLFLCFAPTASGQGSASGPRLPSARGPAVAARAETSPNLSFLDDGAIKLGVDLTMGGAIAYLSRSSDSYTVINVHDLGREVQPSFYGGPTPYGNSHPNYPDWPWNPIAAGDVYGNPSQVVASSNDGHTIYVRTIPMQWALDDVPCECFIETWITLDGKAANVRYRLTNHRPDLTPYQAYGQELPAVLTIGRLHRIFTYDGAAPYTGAPVRQLPSTNGPAPVYRPTEHWVALLDDSGFGLGVLNNDVFPFLAALGGEPDAGGPTDFSLGYIAPSADEILDHNIAYDYEVSLILGTLDDIRAYAVAHRRPELRPDFQFALDRFQEDRQHFAYVNATDSGLPIKGGLHVNLDQGDPQIWLPESRWDASSVPVLYVTAAFHTRGEAASIYWLTPDAGFDESRRVDFPVVADRQFHTYAVSLAASPTYRGIITRLRLDPSDGGVPGDYVTIASISFRPPTSGRGPRVVVR